MELIVNSPKYGKHVIYYDDQDAAILNQYRWNIKKDLNRFYAVATIFIDRKKTSITMHRLLMNPPKEMDIDHRDGNGLNNKRENIRIATRSENSSNSKINSKNTTGFKGVFYKKRRGKFMAYIKKNGKFYFGGHFNNAIDAAKRYNELALIHHGEFAKLNEIPK